MNVPIAHSNQNMSNVISVSDYLNIINNTLELIEVEFKIEGEISSFQKHPTGYYFNLKDTKDASIIACYGSPRLYIDPEIKDGALVYIKGIANVYKPKGRLSLIISDIEIGGEGALKKQYEALKLKLQNEGLFERKRDLPQNISKIGLITSKTGAVIHDFKNNLDKHGYEILFFDSRVEGKLAADHIIKALDFFETRSLDIDVLILIRGGGSLEDLQAFNDESVIRKIIKTKAPIICAIGHDKDTPLAQLVADYAPSTPTAAAVLVNQSWSNTENKITKAKYIFKDKINEISSIPKNQTQRLVSSINIAINLINSLRQKIFFTSQRFDDLNPSKILKKGYNIVRNEKNEVIRDLYKLKKDDKVIIENYNQKIKTKLI